ncbi:MAG: hypothetical protein IJI14_05545 [Anaerolineaceae bacterium]|nr:hypothetical protein [Anaerolineaceae bacterium]
MDINVFFAELESLLKKMEYETATLEGEEIQLGNTLRAMVPVDEAGNKVLLEVMAMPFTEDALLVQIYSTMIAEIGPGYEALKEMLLDWNLTCPLGAFGIYRQGRQFYHKYNYTLPTDGDPKQMAVEVFYIIHLVRDVIGQYFADIVRLSGNL